MPAQRQRARMRVGLGKLNNDSCSSSSKDDLCSRRSVGGHMNSVVVSNWAKAVGTEAELTQAPKLK